VILTGLIEEKNRNMFSGIVAGMGTILSLTSQEGGFRLILDLGSMAKGLKAGDSVAVNGVCLTAVLPKAGQCSFDVITETLKKTNLGALKKGSLVNIERSLRLADRLEGHLVQGHVQGVTPLVKKIATKKDFKLTFKPPKDLLPYIAPLGCVAVNGVSLTVAEVTKTTFTVALIPTTLELTNLGALQEGDGANIETDIVARQIVHFLQKK
jgi:riboflavin synthase